MATSLKEIVEANRAHRKLLDNPPPLSQEMQELEREYDAKYEQQLATSNPQPALQVQVKKAKNTSAKVKKIREIRNRPIHAVVLLLLVAITAYGLLAVGWLIGAVGDAIWQIGQRMHQDKWGIR